MLQAPRTDPLCRFPTTSCTPQVCLGPKTRSPDTLNQFSCTATYAGVQSVPVAADTALLNAIGQVYGWAALTGCDRGTSRSQSPVILVTPQQYPAFQYIGTAIPSVYRQCISQSGFAGVAFDDCQQQKNLRLYPDGGLRNQAGLCYTPGNVPVYQECITNGQGQLFPSQKWAYVSSKYQLKFKPSNQCLQPQPDGSLRMASCSGLNAVSYLIEIQEVATN